MKTLYSIKPLMDRIDVIESVYKTNEKKEEISIIIHDIKRYIDILKQEIILSKETLQGEKERKNSISYENTQDPQKLAIQQKTALDREQAKTMNENISKFLVVYKEKEKIIEERNRTIDEKDGSISMLQQRLNETEQRLKKIIVEYQNDKNKDSIIEEKIRIITTLQQRLQEVENKFRKIALLHKSITEKEQIKDSIIEEKNKFISNLQYRINEIEGRLQSMVTINEDNKEKFLHSRLCGIDKKIQTEERKKWIFFILFLLFLLISIGGFMFLYTSYIQNSIAYTI